MHWPTPEYSRGQVNRAGELLAFGTPGTTDFDWALEVLTNWRSCHNYPINTFQATLRARLKSLDATAIVAQRLKRAPSIISKLQRFDQMKLARMQDVGGLRAVMTSLPKVRQLEKKYLQGSFEHELALARDYIDTPKDSGYRGIHLVYKYRNERVADYDGLQVEIQMRTRLQHAWATAVETMGTFLQQALKSSEGPEEWLRFFAVAGSAFAHLEESAPVPTYEGLTRIETFRAATKEAAQLDVRNRLQAFSVAVNRITRDKQQGAYHLVILNPEEKTVNIQSFGRARLEEANEEYTRVEGRISDGEPIQAVLVSAGPIETLQRAYPNYFLDTTAFLRRLDKIRELASPPARADLKARRKKAARKKSSVKNKAPKRRSARR